MRGIGPQSAEKLAARGLARLRDLWLWLPREYEDRTRLTLIDALVLADETERLKALGENE